MEAGESQVFVSIKMKQRTRMMQVSRNMEEGDWARTGGSDDENAYKPVFLENESSDYTAVFGRLRESLRTKHLQRPVFTVREGSTHSRTRHTLTEGMFARTGGSPCTAPPDAPRRFCPGSRARRGVVVLA